MKPAKLFWVSTLLFSICSLASCDDEADMDTGQPNVFEYLQEDPDFSLFVDAMVRTGLDGPVADVGPITVFAPNNDAFEDYFQAVGAANLEVIPEQDLTRLLMGHMISGGISSAEFTTGYLATLSSPGFAPSFRSLAYIDTENGLRINAQASVTQANIDVANGVIHLLDKVIPPSTVVDFINADTTFTALSTALAREDFPTNLSAVLSTRGPFTFFAPNNQALQSFLDNNEDWNALTDIPADSLESILRYHVTDDGNIRSAELFTGLVFNTILEDKTIFVNFQSQNPRIVGSKSSAIIRNSDLQAQNGVLYELDSVLLR